jgi:single-stranded-DNA-specific exonuclease
MFYLWLSAKVAAMLYKWIFKESPSHKLKSLQEALKISPILCQLLVQRGVDDYDKAHQFFRPQLEHLHSPFLMKNMDVAVARISQAIQNKQRIMVYGDYDVDGTTAVALVYSFLKRHYANLCTYIPDRYREGYGVSLAGIDFAADNEVALIIALDCGIKAVNQVAYAAEKNIDFIICDHHTPGNILPAATAILNPKQKDCSYPYPELSGCGVGFKLVQALCQNWGKPNQEWMVLLDLLAVSIGADIVPITGENRVLAYYGLQLINTKPRLGLQKLMALARRDETPLTITDVVFLLGPRINAAGRIEHGSLAVEMLSGQDPKEIEAICEKVNSLNQERKDLDRTITKAALDALESPEERQRKSTVVFDPGWHKGVIGIVASRLTEKFYRPTVVFTESKGVLAGSARSVKGFNVYKALEKCSDVLQQFGGHKYAAGMTLAKKNYALFKQRFEEAVDQSITKEQLQPKIEIDAVLPFSQINKRFYKILKQFAPFGPLNLSPVFMSQNLKDVGCKRVGDDLSHLRFVLEEPASKIRFTGIGFGLGAKLEELQKAPGISVVYHLEENTFNDRTTLQLRVLDAKPSPTALETPI